MTSMEIEAIRNATGEAIECLHELRDAAENYQAGAKRQSGPRFIKTASRLEAARDALFAALSGRFDAFSGVAAEPVRFGPLTAASAHDALYQGCVMLTAEIAGGAPVESAITEFLHIAPSYDALNDLGARLQQEQARLAPPAAASPPAALPAATANDARDRWIYGKCVKMVQYNSIIRQLAKKNKWEPIESHQGVTRAANRYAKVHDLAPIPSRQPGRTRRKK